MHDFQRRIALASVLAATAALTQVVGPAQAGAAAVPDQGKVCGPTYVKDDKRLGPKYLPHTGPVGRILRGYERYGGIAPNRFIYRYWDETLKPTPFWRYPPDDGFAHDGGYINGRPIKVKVTLRAGKRIDRFGAPTGGFLAPEGIAFAKRALPPDSLNTNSDDPAHVCNYHVYRVVKEFDVDTGPIAPAFQQPGEGAQYHLVGAYVDGAPERLSVKWLLDKQFLAVVS